MRLYRGNGGCGLRWAKTVAEILSLNVADCTRFSFVGHPVTWSRAKVLELLKFIEKKHRLDWHSVISKYWNFSEYQLYGCYASFAKKSDDSYYITSVEYSHQLRWQDGVCPDPLTQQECVEFFDEIKEDEYFGMITSASKTPLENYSNILSRL
ncbi:MAG: DUF6492 family protein [Ilyomonas sp.]